MIKKIISVFIIFFLLVNSVLLMSTAKDSSLASFNFQSAANYSKAMGGYSMLVLEGDRIVFEEYHNGCSADTPVHMHSATKGFWSMVVAALIEDEIISGYDEKVWKSIDEWQKPWYLLKHRITIRNMVELTTGLEQDVDAIQGHENYTAYDIYNHTINNLSFRTFPGRDFQYGPSHYYLLGALMESKGLNPLTYLEQRIFDPIGLRYDTWTFDPSGNPHIPNGAYLTAREWVKYGKLLRDKGNWNGTQIVNQQLVEQLLIPSERNPGHGKFLWLNTKNGFGYPEWFMKAPEGSKAGFIYHDGFEDLFAAMGAGKNRLYIIPSLDLVIVRQSNHESDRFNDHEFLDRLLNTSNHPPIAPTVFGDKKGNIDEEYTIICSSTDSEQDQISYYVDWDDGTYTEWTPYIDSGEQQSITHHFDSHGRYAIRVKAKDEHGAESSWTMLRMKMTFSLPRIRTLHDFLDLVDIV